MAGRILGMGDVVGLVEKAQEVDRPRRRPRQRPSRCCCGSFTLEDFLAQLRMIKKLGPLKGLSMIPMPGQLGQAFEQADVKETGWPRGGAVPSMTPRERLHPELIDAGRRRRIARGSGNEVVIVNQILRQHEQMRDMMKRFNSGGVMSKLGRMFGGGGDAAAAMPGGGRDARAQQEMLAKLQRGAATAEKDPDEEARRRAARKREKEARKKNRKRR